MPFQKRPKTNHQPKHFEEREKQKQAEALEVLKQQNGK